MFNNPKKIISHSDSLCLGARISLWQETDGSKYVSHQDSFYGPLTEEQVAAYEILRGVCLEPDNWIVPKPLINISSIPIKIKTIDTKDVAIQGARYRIHSGVEVILTGYRLPESRNEGHKVIFKLINVPGAGEYEADIKLFDLNSIANI